MNLQAPIFSYTRLYGVCSSTRRRALLYTNLCFNLFFFLFLFNPSKYLNLFASQQNIFSLSVLNTDTANKYTHVLCIYKTGPSKTTGGIFCSKKASDKNLNSLKFGIFSDTIPLRIPSFFIYTGLSINGLFIFACARLNSDMASSYSGELITSAVSRII